jgi:hypothetical protein
LPHDQFKRALIRRALPTYLRELVGQVSGLPFF